jgi:hypothetical protein
VLAPMGTMGGHQTLSMGSLTESGKLA